MSNSKVFLIVCFTWFVISSYAQTLQPYIVVDQFGYRPGDQKTAVIADPQIGYNAEDSFSPGDVYQVRRKSDASLVFEGSPAIWNGGVTSQQSGDKGWWFDFSAVTDPGEYYIYDVEKDARSYYFRIDQNIYKDMLRAATKMFYFQRLQMVKEEQYAGDFADGFAVPMDTVCRDINDKDNPEKIKDMSRGWFDAGDNHKYVTFTMEPVNQLLTAYTINPDVFTDDFNIPESGNGIPDILDEVKWELDWLKKMQDTTDGGAYLKVVYHNRPGPVPVPPSSDTYPRYYMTPKRTAATIDIACIMAHAYLVYRDFPEFEEYAEDCKKRAIQAWNYFHSNPMNYSTGKLERADRSADTQMADAYTAAIYLFAATGKQEYHDYIIDNFSEYGPSTSSWGLYNNHRTQACLYYASLSYSDADLASRIFSLKKQTYEQNSGGFTRWNANLDLYRSYMSDYQYHWGSNQPKANVGNTLAEFLNYHIIPEKHTEIRNHALDFLHYFHGVNPVGYTYLTSMEEYGGDKCTKYVWHQWYQTNVCPPGYIPGGPNHSYSPDESYNGVLAPPEDQPPQKSFKDWSVTWPDKSWEITEPAIYYQAAYVFLVSNFAHETERPDLPDSIEIISNRVDTLLTTIDKTYFVRFFPANSTGARLSWNSSDTSLLQVDSLGNVFPRRAGLVNLKVTAENGVSDSVDIQILPCAPMPYNNKAATIPGIIEAENYDTGCDNYFDTDSKNNGGAYRPAEGVDLERTADESGLYNIGWINPGEWTRYTVQIEESDTYVIECRLAAISPSKLSIEFDNRPSIIESVSFPSSGGYQNWFSHYSDTIHLTEGKTSMKLTFQTSGFNINYVAFNKYVPVTGLRISTDTISMITDQTMLLTAEVDGEEGAIKEITWSSDDPAVVSVDENGYIRAVKPGATYVRATTIIGNVTDSVFVQVIPVVHNVQILDDPVELHPGEEQALSVEVVADEGADVSLSWYTSNTEVATVNASGKVRALEPGSAYVTAKSVSFALADSVFIEVTSWITDINIQPDTIRMFVAEDTLAIAEVTGVDGANKEVSWSSRDPDIAIVDETGRISALSEGSVYITATTTVGGLSDSVYVEVYEYTNIIENNSEMFTVYPNPVDRGVIGIQCSRVLPDMTVQLFDTSGKMVYNKSFKASSNNQHIIQTWLKGGPYVLKILGAEWNWSQIIIIE